MTRWKSETPTEFEEQCKLAEYLDRQGYCWCHVPNGGNRDAKTGAKMKKQGAKKGFPDVQIFDEPNKIRGMVGTRIYKHKGVIIEMKRQNGSPSDVSESQKEWLQKLEARGWLTKVCYGADEAIDWLEQIFEEEK